MIFCYSHGSLPCSAITKEAYSVRRWEQIQRPTARHCAERELGTHISKWYVSIKFHPWKRKQKECGNQRVWRTSGEKDPPNQLKKPHMNSRRVHQQARGLHGCAPGPLHMYYSFQVSVSMGLLSV